MPSGSTVTGDGLTTMTQVVAGTDTVLDTDFNTARTNVDLLMGDANDRTLGTYDATYTYGWQQGGAGVSAASDGGLIYADNATGGFKRLQDDVQAMCAFLGVSVRTGVGSDVSAGGSVTAATWNNLMLNIQDCWNARFSPSSTTTTSSTAATRTTSWNTSVTQTTTFSWTDERYARAWFNAGGALGFSASRSGGSSTTQNTNWTDLLSAMGDVMITHNTGSGSSGTNAGIGFYELSTSYQTIWTKFGSGSYASNFFKMEGKIDSTTNPKIVTLQATFSDPHAEGSGALGPDGIASTGDEAYGNDYIDGTLTLTPRVKVADASGSGFAFNAPSVGVGGMSGS